MPDERILLSVTLVGNGQLLAAFGAAGSQYTATIGGSHSLTETMLVVPSAVVGLECSFHIFSVLLLCAEATKTPSLMGFGVQN